jgi:hypothetical protein
MTREIDNAQMPEIPGGEIGGLEHEIAVRLNNLAAVHQARGAWAEAERLYLRTLEIQEKLLGPDHPDFALTIHNLASLFATRNRTAEARVLWRHALAIFMRTLGPEHPRSLACRQSYEALRATRRCASGTAI